MPGLFFAVKLTMHVLLIEDDELIASGIRSGLHLHAMTVDGFTTASAATQALAVGHFDVAVLDLGLPDDDGLSVLKRWRQAGYDLPVLILTARDAIENRITGLQAGADDYLIKPFDLGELVARLQALQRRVAGRSVSLLQHGELSFDPVSFQVTLGGEPIELSRRELLLLQAFLNKPNHILTPDQVKDSLYGMDDEIESNALNVHLHNLRKN
ncbi:response regulator [Chitinibacter sp. FCG-7]|uniref:Response regulator n=1 Tax=Chitinibacter mangrovi TaxID=3153927 RepID=A0AAU7FBT3_9NEIS